jgi:O-acetyl-ADP-ribose deacetylase (regulator of RNase III)
VAYDRQTILHVNMSRGSVVAGRRSWRPPWEGLGDMPIAFVFGDLLANRYNAPALAQGCNCRGSKGAGVATGFRHRYPDMFEEYRRRCKAAPCPCHCCKSSIGRIGPTPEGNSAVRVARVGLIDLWAQAELRSARRSDTPKRVVPCRRRRVARQASLFRAVKPTTSGGGTSGTYGRAVANW